MGYYTSLVIFSLTSVRSPWRVWIRKYKSNFCPKYKSQISPNLWGGWVGTPKFLPFIPIRSPKSVLSHFACLAICTIFGWISSLVFSEVNRILTWKYCVKIKNDNQNLAMRKQELVVWSKLQKLQLAVVSHSACIQTHNYHQLTIVAILIFIIRICIIIKITKWTKKWHNLARPHVKDIFSFLSVAVCLAVLSSILGSNWSLGKNQRRTKLLQCSPLKFPVVS